MKKRIHDALLGTVGLAGVAFFALSGAGCESPTMQCAVGHGAFTVVYNKVISGDPSCYNGPHQAFGSACSQYEVPDDAPFCTGLSRVEHVGFSTYLGVKNRKETDVKYTNADGEEVTYKSVSAESAEYNTRTIAAKSSTLGALFQAVGLDSSLGQPYALGAYSSNPDANNICYAGDGSALAIAELNVPDPDPANAIHYRQEWNDVRFYVTEGVPGTQTVGKMKFENVLDSCTVEYEFTGLYPAVFCGIEVRGHKDATGTYVEGHEDNDGDPATPADNDTNDDDDPATPVDNDTDDDGDPMTPVDNDDADPSKPDVDADYIPVIRYEPDNLACDPKADPAAGRVFGSGINPDFKTYCHPEYVHCVLNDGTGLIK